jgi:hypothetical protein
LEVTCHSDGRVYGLSTRNALLYAASTGAVDSAIEADFEAWIAEHPAELGLSAGLSIDDIGLSRMPNFRSSAGPLTIFRFAQTYRGLPVLAPDGIVTLVYGPRGAIAVTGAVIDGRTPYDHHAVQASAEEAMRSLLVHASEQSGVPVGQLEIVHATPVAMPERQAIGWTGLARKKTGGAMLARVIVDADPGAGPVLPLWSYRTLAVEGLEDTQPILAHGLATGSDLTALAYADHTTLTTGVPLLGSVDDVSQEIQLATGRVVVLDLHGMKEEELVSSATRVTSPSGEFLAEDATGLSAQTAYHLFQSWYDFVDQRLTDPVTGTKRWDSATALYSSGTYSNDTPPGTFAPRVLVFADSNAADCPASATACASQSGHPVTSPQGMTFPELVHVPPGASKQEATGTVRLLGEGVEPVTLAHEFGHMIDLFTGGGIIDDFAPGCDGPCAPECIAGTSDEAPPLTETVAQLLAFVFLHQSFEGVDWGHCSIVDLVSVNGDKPWTPGPCMPAGEDISLFQRPSECTKPSAYCDQPEDPGFEPRCCFDDEDLSECTLVVPTQCPAGAVSSTGGVGTGTARATPTGLCAKQQGYATNSVFQAFWQLLNGQRCDPTPPFACVSATWPPGVDPATATTDAFLYALRVNALTYDELFAAMATYVSCTYGAAAYDEFNAVVCNHGIRDCDLDPPMECQHCGNGVREGNETCDGADWLVTRCEDMPQYTGGTLTCDMDFCMLDESQCSMPGLDTTAGTMTPGETTMTNESTTSIDAESATETEPAAASDGSDGCDCRAGASGGAWLALSPLSLLGARRRRRPA